MRSWCDPVTPVPLCPVSEGSWVQIRRDLHVYTHTGAHTTCSHHDLRRLLMWMSYKMWKVQMKMVLQTFINFLFLKYLFDFPSNYFNFNKKCRQSSQKHSNTPSHVPINKHKHIAHKLLSLCFNKRGRRYAVTEPLHSNGGAQSPVPL